jgi:hypothetical protein
MRREIRKMVYRIFKYKIPVTDEVSISLPKGATLLSVKEQNDGIVLYAEINPDEMKMVQYDFRIVGTGHRYKFDRRFYKFLDTVKLYGGQLMFHVFVCDHKL